MRRVFISYRRKDSQSETDRIYDKLRTHFGEEQIFRDLHSIPPSADFRKVITEALDRCTIILVVIGDQWATVTGVSGGPRLQDPDDPVRVEVETALQKDVAVIPLLVRGATMPRASDLPPTLAPLVARNAMVVSPDPYFHFDVDRLTRVLELMGLEPVGYLWVVRALQRALLPPGMHPAFYGDVVYLLFFWAFAASVIGGLLWNLAVSGLLGFPVAEPHGWLAVAWPVLTMLPVLSVLYVFAMSHRLLDGVLLIVLLLLFLAGMVAGSLWFYDVPWGGGNGVRGLIDTAPWPFQLKEFCLVVIWSTALAVSGFLGMAIGRVIARGEAGRVARRWAWQVGLCVLMTTLVVMTFVLLFPAEENVAGRGVLAAVALRVSLFFGLLQHVDRTLPSSWASYAGSMAARDMGQVGE